MIRFFSALHVDVVDTHHKVNDPMEAVFHTESGKPGISHS